MDVHYWRHGPFCPDDFCRKSEADKRQTLELNGLKPVIGKVRGLNLSEIQRFWGHSGSEGLTNTYMRERMACVHAHTHILYTIHGSVYMCVCIHMYTCMCVYIDKHVYTHIYVATRKLQLFLWFGWEQGELFLIPRIVFELNGQARVMQFFTAWVKHSIQPGSVSHNLRLLPNIPPN